MSKKDVEKYYNQITADYKDMVDALKELEEAADQQIVNPDKIENIKAAIEPLKNNYQRISYIMFLLNQPTRKSKVPGYVKRNKKFLAEIKSNVSEHEENQKVISTLNDVWTGKVDKE